MGGRGGGEVVYWDSGRRGSEVERGKRKGREGGRGRVRGKEGRE